MSSEEIRLFTVFGFGVVLVLITGIYCIVTTRNLIRTLIGLELMTKSVTLLLIVAGHLAGRIAVAQSLAITLIVVEVAVIVVAVGIVLNLYWHNNSLDTARLRNLKG